MDAQMVVGLVAGRGQLPMLVAQGIKASGGRVCCVGLAGQFDSALPPLCDRFERAGILQLGRWIKLLKRFGATEAIMVGGVEKTKMHDPFRILRQLPDLRAVDLWYRRLRHDRRNATLLAAVADELLKSGITLIDSTTFIPDHLADEGVMTATTPTAAQLADIEFAWPLLQELVRLDIGQSIAVRDRDVIAVEAVEGTDRMIDRAGVLCPAGGWTLGKTTDLDHDRRADVPTIGVQTIERLAATGGRCIVLGARRVILIDKPKVLAAADRARIAIVGR